MKTSPAKKTNVAPQSYVEKIAEKQLKFKTYKDAINATTDGRALAIVIAKMDKAVMEGGFEKMRKAGFTNSKRGMRLMNVLFPEMKTAEAAAVLEAKQGYMYSTCKKQNKLSTAAYKSVRGPFLKQADAYLKELLAIEKIAEV